MKKDTLNMQEGPINISYETGRRNQTSLKPHTHEDFEIYYLVKGKRYMWVKDKRYLLDAGDIMLIPSNKIHYTSAYKEESHSRIFINFTKNYIDSILGEIKEIDLISIFYPTEKKLSFPPKKRKEIELLFANIQKEVVHHYKAYDVSIKFYLMQLLLVLIRSKDCIVEEKIPKQRKNTDYMESLITFINDNYKEPLTLTLLGEKFFINPSALSRSIKRYLGINFNEFLLEKRITQAKELLRFTTMNVTDIGEQVGFNSTSYFERVFKAHIGMSPMQYRKEVSEPSTKFIL